MTEDAAKEDLFQTFSWVHDRLLQELARRQKKRRKAAAERPPIPAPILHLAKSFDLSPFETDVLILLAAAQVDLKTQEILADLSDGNGVHIRFDLTLSVLPEAHWSAIAPSRPLRRWRLLTFDETAPIIAAHLKIDERILLFALGVHSTDARLLDTIRPMGLNVDLPETQSGIVDAMAKGSAIALRQGATPVLQLFGGDQETMAEIASAFYNAHGLAPWKLLAHTLPQEPAQVALLADLWRRETALDAKGLVIDTNEIERGGDTALSHFVNRLDTPVVTTSIERQTWPSASHTFEVSPPTIEEQTDLWRMAFPDDEETARQIAHSFTLEARDILALVATLQAETANDTSRKDTAWRICRKMAAPRIVSGVTVIEPSGALSDLKLPAAQTEVIQQIDARMSQRARVYGKWGYDANGGRGIGVSALFSGPSGTGKTFAAELVAAELKLDLHRVDVSSVVNKYIGETEKALHNIFTAAEASGAVLLFDEADALFGKRGEVKDSHDRYSNIGVSYLLQRLEAYRGLAILTTNLKDNIDSAFLRRFTYLVEFPYPDQALRRQIWEDAFTADTPLGDLDMDTLSGFAVSGAEIRNIALGAAFLAAADDSNVTMTCIKRAATAELEKAGRKLTQADIRGWSL